MQNASHFVVYIDVIAHTVHTLANKFTCVNLAASNQATSISYSPTWKSTWTSRKTCTCRYSAKVNFLDSSQSLPAFFIPLIINPCRRKTGTEPPSSGAVNFEQVTLLKQGYMHVHSSRLPFSSRHLYHNIVIC